MWRKNTFSISLPLKLPKPKMVLYEFVVCTCREISADLGEDMLRDLYILMDSVQDDNILHVSVHLHHFRACF